MKHQPFKPGCYYHVFNRGNNKEKIFLRDGNYDYFLKLLKKHIAPVAEVYSYCLLSNHFHVVLKIKDEENLPKQISLGNKKLHQPFSNLFNAYAKAFNKENNRTGSVFQEHLKRVQIDGNDYLKKLIMYINTNPSHHFIEDYTSYKFSSYQSILSNKETALKRAEVLRLFDGIENFKYVHALKNTQIGLLKELSLE